MKNDNIEQSQSAKNTEMGALSDFQTFIMFQNQNIKKKLKGGPFGIIRKIAKKSLIVQKTIPYKNTQVAKVGFLSCFQGSERRFSNLGWGSKVCGIIWSN